MALISSQCVCRCAQNSFYHFWTVEICVTFSLLTVAAFLESSKMPTAD